MAKKKKASSTKKKASRSTGRARPAILSKARKPVKRRAGGTRGKRR